jgi:hypothetical protein
MENDADNDIVAISFYFYAQFSLSRFHLIRQHKRLVEHEDEENDLISLQDNPTISIVGTVVCFGNSFGGILSLESSVTSRLHLALANVSAKSRGGSVLFHSCLHSLAPVGYHRFVVLLALCEVGVRAAVSLVFATFRSLLDKALSILSDICHR